VTTQVANICRSVQIYMIKLHTNDHCA
jgi:hypothetical protein